MLFTIIAIDVVYKSSPFALFTIIEVDHYRGHWHGVIIVINDVITIAMIIVLPTHLPLEVALPRLGATLHAINVLANIQDHTVNDRW